MAANAQQNYTNENRSCINADNLSEIFSYRKLLHLTNTKIGSANIAETINIKLLGIIFDKQTNKQ